jgi:hypothetical protein
MWIGISPQACVIAYVRSSTWYAARGATRPNRSSSNSGCKNFSRVTVVAGSSFGSLSRAATNARHAGTSRFHARLIASRSVMPSSSP